jgi:hypothetical protein
MYSENIRNARKVEYPGKFEAKIGNILGLLAQWMFVLAKPLSQQIHASDP